MGRLRLMRPEKNPEEREIFLKFVEPIIAQGRGRVTAEGMIDDFRTDKSACWGFVRDGEVTSVGVTTILVYPSGKRVMRCSYGGGTLRDALEVMPQVEMMAKRLCCDTLRIEGRKGWQRIFTDGWEEVSRVLEKEI